ncbi:MAG TPA: carboxypeptidase-like regulatory domain-containing protein [Candidatus Dormibacteraeota bacterium]
MRLRATVFATAIVALALPAHSATPLPLPSVVQVLGSVTNSARPVGNALVIALNLTNLETSQTFTSIDGTFNLPQLPAGIYKIIALKYGFAPAMAMLVPTQREHRVKLRLVPEGQSKRDVSQEMWEIRGSVPPDILRQIDNVMAPPPAQAAALHNAYDLPRLRGEMVSMTGVAAQTSSPAFAQTAIGVQSRISDDWQLGFRGNLHRVEDPTDDRNFGTPVAESSGMQMELRSSPTDAYRLASTKSWWRFNQNGDANPDQQQADIRTHNLEWEHDDTHVQVRYLGQQNLFAGTPGSDLIEIAGNTTVLQTRRSGVGVALRVTQESLRNVNNATFRTADLTANAKFELVPTFVVNYGMSSRLGLYGTEWAPRTGAEWKVGKDTAFVVSGMYKVYDQERPNVLPSVVVWSDDSHLLPRYSYSFGIVSGEDGTDRFSAIGSVSATDAPMRVIFNDGFEHFWDGLYIETGDVRRDVRLAYRKELGKRLLVDVSSSAGVATPRLETLPNREKVYVTGDVESTYFPTRTTLAVSYRQIHQPQPIGAGADYRTERVDVRVAQALHLLLDFKLLAGVEVARALNSPILLDTLEPDGVTRRYIGGVALNF